MTGEIQKRFEEAGQYDDMMARVFPGYEQLPLVVLSHLRTCLASNGACPGRRMRYRCDPDRVRYPPAGMVVCRR